MGLFDEKHEFSSMHIPVSTRIDDLRTTYRIYMISGEVHEVHAASAAEAVEKSGIHENILRIANAAHEARLMLDTHVLNPNGMAVATDISMEQKKSVLIAADDNALHIPKAEFSLFNLVEYAHEVEKLSPKDAPEPESTLDNITSDDITQQEDSVDTQQQDVSEEMAEAVPTSAAEPADIIPEEIPEKELSPEEVRNLLHAPAPDTNNL
jgi:hypothetical protein